MFGTRNCARCDKNVDPAEALIALDKTWHKTCFNECEMILNTNNYKDFDKMPYCDKHYNDVRKRKSEEPPVNYVLTENPRKSDVTPIPNTTTTRILVFGTSGVGKSSLIKLITGDQLIRTSDAAVGCTKKKTDYEFHFENQHSKYAGLNTQTINDNKKIGDCILIDTAGLNEGEQGTVKASESIEQLFELFKSLRNGLNLIIYVTKQGTQIDNNSQNLELIKFLVHGKKIPYLCVVTHCDSDDLMNWWEKEEKNIKKIVQFQFTDGCSVCCKDISELNDKDKNFYSEKVEKSMPKLFQIIKKHVLSKPHLFYCESSGFMKFLSEFTYYIRYKRFFKWFFDNKILLQTIEILKKSGIEEAEAKKMMKQIEINRPS
jgi:GTP-binding protein EngB required for normal cell division